MTRSTKIGASDELMRANARVHQKFVRLTQTQDHPPDIQVDDSFIKNLTDVEIPQDMRTVLSLGPKFSIEPNTDPIIDLASDVELAIQREVPIESQRTARGEAVYSIAKFSKQVKKLTRIDRFLQRAFKKTREFLQQHPNLMVSNSDKGNVTIISNKEDYHRKIEELLSDLEAFTPIETDPTKTVANALNRCLDNLYKANILQAKLKTSLKTFNAIRPRLFAQIKYHKEGNPVRLIVSTVNSAAYKVSRFLATILRKSFTSKYSVKNAQQFVKQMKGINITAGNVLVSFDVVNCFGNIPTKLALEIISRDFHLVEEHTPIPKDKFMKMLEICLNKANYFTYKGKCYRQNRGMFMGSSLAPILVERVIEEFVNRAIEDLKLDPDFWSTYVDDHLTSIPESKIETLKNKLNSYDENVQFTVEVQDMTTRSINFLDLKVYNEGTQLKTNWYHKAIASNRILNFHAKHPKNMVRNVAKSFIKRVFSVSHRSFHESNLHTVKQILTKNSFPPKMIDKMVSEVTNKYKFGNVSREQKSYPFLDATKPPERKGPLANSTMHEPKEISFKEMTTTPPPKYPKRALGYAGITYIEGVSETIKTQLKVHAPQLKLAFRPPCKVSQAFTNMKDKVEDAQQSNVVYGIPCIQCRVSYIGETSRCLSERCSQHEKDVANVAKKPTKTALVRHVSTTQHQFDFNSAKILRKVRTRGLLKIHEANHIILNEQSVVNFKKDAKHVSPVVYNLIKKKMIGKSLRNQNIRSPTPLHTSSTESEQSFESVEQMFRQ
ncbi:uncharacterized protein LOC119071404 [Bradysia coprophila]|uniref:uncharacterized protein LOC119071404 n=1 Tax=Bradysia coprophila TaxID=38358 RepID=UPI00187DA4B4|nr:uncharacterized protein LOC119071404 [Bradysia coprophila]